MTKHNERSEWTDMDRFAHGLMEQDTESATWGIDGDMTKVAVLETVAVGENIHRVAAHYCDECWSHGKVGVQDEVFDYSPRTQHQVNADAQEWGTIVCGVCGKVIAGQTVHISSRKDD